MLHMCSVPSWEAEDKRWNDYCYAITIFPLSFLMVEKYTKLLVTSAVYQLEIERTGIQSP